MPYNIETTSSYNTKIEDLLYEYMVGILTMRHQQVTLDTVTPETEYKNLNSKELNMVREYYNYDTMLAENEMLKAYIIMKGGLE